MSLEREKELTARLKNALQSERNMGQQMKQNYDKIVQLEALLDAEKSRINALRHEINVKEEIITGLKKQLREKEEREKAVSMKHQAEIDNNQKYLIKKQQEIEKLVLEKDR